MALRVLLADESSTIKKVIQLALSDFGVEVKAVPVGLDVLAVTKSFKPDIVFADVLLTKRSGYEVSLDLKNDPETTKIPVVLMWSGFMEIDEAKAKESRADGRLEKPFDADNLRNLVNSLVQKTTTNPVSSFISFPEMPDFEETPAEPTSTRESALAGEISNVFDIPEADENGTISHPLETSDEEFASVPLTATPRSQDEADEGGWAHQDLSKFKIQVPDTESTDFASKFVIPQAEDLDHAHVEVAGDFEEISFHENGPDLTETFAKKVEKSVKDQMIETLQKKAPVSNAEPKAQSKMDMNSNMMEKIIREEAREVIESICWKMLPEIAERVVREEINKILRDTEKF
ncbi:response regulator [Bdellovibrio sp. HCB2-146]|uniref:response regulator n=1 Tax=Bdellovibrio sp. HCB2-146 TaxID=3394362 RepID=UPI0039BD1024